MGFHTRAWQHDNIAFPLFKERLKKYNVQIDSNGIETDPILANELQYVNTELAREIRHKEDFILTFPNKRRAFAEVKTGDNKYPNFAIEAAAFGARKNISKTILEKRFMVFINVDDNSIKAINTKDLPDPKEIFVPLREDNIEIRSLLSKYFPNALLRQQPKQTIGSGTPFFLIPKNYELLEEFDAFITKTLLPPLSWEERIQYNTTRTATRAQETSEGTAWERK
jgi:hypothetical protein